MDFKLDLILFVRLANTAIITFNSNVFSDGRRILNERGNNVSRGVLAYSNLASLSGGNGTVIFIISHFSTGCLHSTRRGCPRVFSRLRNFADFSGCASLCTHAFPTIASVLAKIRGSFSLSHARCFGGTCARSRPLGCLTGRN